MRSSRLTFAAILFAGLLLCACAAAPTQGIPSPVQVSDTPPLVSTVPASVTPSLEPRAPAGLPEKLPSPALTGTPISPSITVTPSPSPTATLALPTRLPAKNWKEWPVVPAITNRARQIYQAGLGRNDPHAFSKVGDCQGIKEVWLGVYDQPGLYTLSPENAALQQTIDWFRGSFNRNGFAVMGGFNARAVLQPSVADPAFCQAGENPVECEYRQHHPSLVLVSLEFYYDGRTAQNYEGYLRQVLDFFIARGVVPILATKADNMEGDESLNLTTAKLALEYDLPLWNFWKAVQPLPDHGMDATRPDGFHISVDAWRERSATALQALDSLWRGLRDILPAAVGVTSTPPPSSAASATPNAPSPAPAATPATQALSTRVVLSLAERGASAPQPKGVYLLDVKAESLVQLLDDRYQLQAVSPDGARLLVNQGRDLYLANIDGTGLKKLASDFFPYGRTGAAWLPDGASLLYIADRSGRGIWQMAADGSAAQRLTPPQSQPFELVPGLSGAEFFWADGACALAAGGVPLPGECQAGNWYRSNIDGSAPFGLTRTSNPLRAPDGQSLAYTYLSEKSKPVLAITTGDLGQIWTPLPEGYVIDYAWSPSGRWLAALWQERSDYSGKITAQKLYLLSLADLRRDEQDLTINQNGRVSWSPDGRYLLLTGTETNASGYRLNLRLVTVNGGGITVLDGKISPSGANFMYVSNLAWVPGK